MLGQADWGMGNEVGRGFFPQVCRLEEWVGGGKGGFEGGLGLGKKREGE